ncbi:sodium:solute symporter family protein [Candidatus Ichthyocystis sparus]|uniref:sodium:solute symporter family protein n=1 Tax=Candidatus Ichthyocystis sparus TaxID=1561004 RepID=UPI00159ED9FF|nr:sodium:solute symporter family protein [Candidatus Ichthyocystis sparus]
MSSSNVKTLEDFVSADGKLPVYLLAPVVVCSWIGGGTLIGAPAIFVDKGISGIFGDPLGTTMCLWLVALFLGKTIYREKVVTLGEYFRKRFGRQVEQVLSLAIIASYLGWSVSVIHAAQIVIQLLTGEAFGKTSAAIVSGLVITAYTILGGMWSAALTNYIITAAVLSGLFWVFYSVSAPLGGIVPLVEIAINQGKFTFFPDTSAGALLAQFSNLSIMMLGLMPQQDLLQRINSATNERTVRSSHLIGGAMYLLISMVPILTAYAVKISHPDISNHWMQKDPQFVLPMYILTYSSTAVKVCFFGALFSGLLTSGSASMLAPSVSLVENIIRPFKDITNEQALFLSRAVVVLFALGVTTVDILSSDSIYQQILNAYSVTLVLVLVPMVAGLYWKKANIKGVLFSVILGIVFWALSNFTPSEFPGVLVGVSGSALGMVLGSMLPSKSLNVIFRPK